MLTHLTITGLYASILALFLIALAVNIIKLRFKFQVGLGDGGEQPLIKAIRIHGNFTEYMPLALILLASYELNGGDELYLHIIGLSLVAGRVLHMLGLTTTVGASLPRQIGILATFIVLFALAVLNILKFIG
ncbi:MAG: glutathione S-transferase [Gammaproteobacteria bacterium]|nr:MAG: glutathione S-transferase [Gammaproteobacteria bacterium]